jgi:hypothetical protein
MIPKLDIPRLRERDASGQWARISNRPGQPV